MYMQVRPMKAGEPLSPFFKKHKRKLLWLVPLTILLFLFFLNLGLQTFWAHRHPYFAPDYARVDLLPVLNEQPLSEADYDIIFFQTGLGKPAIDQLLVYGQGGIDQILATQDGFFADHEFTCQVLLMGRFTCEDRIVSPNDQPAATVPLALVEPGDIIISFSTHTFGWRHGHASLVVDTAQGITLEAVVMGSDSAQMNMQHWRTYSNFMVLRIADATPEERQQVAQFALEHLDGIPYGLTSGIFGDKAPDPLGRLTAQCAYLPWYAWQAFDRDLDSDGGRIVTVADLANSPLVEVVQVYGIDPRTLS